ncbi:MAG TPA: hypothetical protein VKV80_15800 [Streptosporangiaceae bacterium]|nr:hypothetical protein [Streptosporangiaceae bacterium]
MAVIIVTMRGHDADVRVDAGGAGRRGRRGKGGPCGKARAAREGAARTGHGGTARQCRS